MIGNLVSEKNVIFPLQHSKITCFASDIDSDNLTYEWSANGGSIAGEGPIVTWTAPYADGTYNITVVVTDGLGGESKSSLTIDVKTNHRPIIDG